jgi:holo-[acyl-carrier protein] synthase
MILGIGTDLTEIARIRQALAQFGERFIRRLYTEREIATANRRADPAPTYAKRFAAKEACAKALGTGIRHGVFFRDMGVVNLPTGQPSLELTGGALLRLMQMMPDGYRPRLHLTITDDAHYAQAFVIIEAVRDNRDLA